MSETYPEPGDTQTTGHAGSETSRDRATSERDSGKTGERGRTVLHLLGQQGSYGMTVAELRGYTDWHHGQASSALTNLHLSNQIDRPTETRDRCKVYVLPQHVNARPVEAPGRTKANQPSIPGPRMTWSLSGDERQALVALKADMAAGAIPRMWAVRMVIEALEVRS